MNRNFKKVIIPLLLLISMSIFGQDIKRARSIVETLALPYFHGRGYVNGGDSLAAEFIAKEFLNSGLKAYDKTYFQSFSFPVNTFPGNMKVKIGRTQLIPGRDFILNPASKEVKGRFRIIKLDSTMLSNQEAIIYPSSRTYKTALAYPAAWRKNIKNLPIPIQKQISQVPVKLEIEEKKLTFSVAGFQSDITTIQMLHGLPSNKLKVNINSKMIENHPARNVIGYIEGSSKKDSFLIITAHYDHLGKLGRDTYFPGANDNASGIAMLLELARFYGDSTNPSAYSMVFIAFAGEEAGLLGSSYFVENPLFDLKKIKFLVNLDLLGSGKDGITVVNGSLHKNEFSLLDSLNKETKGLPKIVARGPAANSDHYPFSERGVPAFFIYTLGEITAYHDIDDKPEVVTFSKFSEVFTLITRFLKEM